MQQLKQMTGQESRTMAESAIELNKAYDQEYVNLKFHDWLSKMLCGTCNQNENEVILPCGHLYCQECIEKSYKSRSRQCHYDRRKISKNDIIKIYWGGSVDASHD